MTRGTEGDTVRGQRSLLLARIRNKAQVAITTKARIGLAEGGRGANNKAWTWMLWTDVTLKHRRAMTMGMGIGWLIGRSGMGGAIG